MDISDLKNFIAFIHQKLSLFFFCFRKSEFGIWMRGDWCKEEGKWWLAVWLAMRKRQVSLLLLCTNHRVSEFRIPISENKKKILTFNDISPSYPPKKLIQFFYSLFTLDFLFNIFFVSQPYVSYGTRFYS